MNIGRGILSGIKGSADAYSEGLKEKGKRDYESEKSNVLYQRQQNLARMNNQFAVDRAKTAQDNTVINEGNRSKSAMDQDANKMRLAEEAANRSKTQRGKVLASQLVPGFNDLSADDQKAAIDRVNNQFDAAGMLGGESVSNKDIISMYKEATKSWEIMSEDERNNYGSQEAYITQMVQSLKGKSGFSYKWTKGETDKATIDSIGKMADDVYSTGSRGDAIKLISQYSDPVIQSKLQEIIDDVYPTKGEARTATPTEDYWSKSQGYANKDFVSRELSRPTALDAVRNTKVPVGFTKPLEGLLGKQIVD